MFSKFYNTQQAQNEYQEVTLISWKIADGNGLLATFEDGYGTEFEIPIEAKAKDFTLLGCMINEVYGCIPAAIDLNKLIDHVYFVEVQHLFDDTTDEVVVDIVGYDGDALFSKGRKFGNDIGVGR